MNLDDHRTSPDGVFYYHRLSPDVTIWDETFPTGMDSKRKHVLQLIHIHK